MCSNEKSGFFMMISRKYGETYRKSLKEWINYKLKICLAKQQRLFLIRCRSYDLLPPHIYNCRFYVTLKDFRVNMRFGRLKNNFQRTLLNLEIKDIHCKINFLTSKVVNIERYLRAGLPVDLLKNFYDSNNNKLRHYNGKVSVKLRNKFNKINSFQNSEYNNFFNIDNSKWVVNNSNKVIPESVTRFLSLGERFAVPINVNNNKDRMDTALMFVKNFEASSYKFSERVVDKVRSLIVNSLSVNLYSIFKKQQ